MPEPIDATFEEIEDSLAPGLGTARLKVEGGPNDRAGELSAEVYDALERRASEILRKRVALEAEQDALRSDIKSAFAIARALVLAEAGVI